MADNLNAPATGSTLATDDIGGVHYPRAKLSLGADGAAVDAIGGAGAVSAAVQRMTLASDDPAVAALAALVTLITTQAGYLDGVEGGIGSTNTALAAIAGYVDGLEGLITASNALLTTQNGYLDGVEGLLSPLATQATLAALNGKIPGLGAALAAASLPVALATDQTVPVSSTTGVSRVAAGNLALNATTTAYPTGKQIGSGPVAFVMPGITGSGILQAIKVVSSDPLANSWGGTTIQVDVFSAQPTLNGERADYLITAGGAAWLGSFQGDFQNSASDAQMGRLFSLGGVPLFLAGAVGRNLYLAAKTIGASGVLTASQTMTFTAEIQL